MKTKNLSFDEIKKITFYAVLASVLFLAIVISLSIYNLFEGNEKAVINQNILFTIGIFLILLITISLSAQYLYKKLDTSRDDLLDKLLTNINVRQKEIINKLDAYNKSKFSDKELKFKEKLSENIALLEDMVKNKNTQQEDIVNRYKSISKEMIDFIDFIEKI